MQFDGSEKFHHVPRSKFLHLLPLSSAQKSFEYAVAISLFYESVVNSNDFGSGGILGQLDSILNDHFILESPNHEDGEECAEIASEEDWLHKLNIETSSLTRAERQFVLLNAAKLDFCVNLLGIWKKKVYPIVLGIGEGNSAKNRRKHVVNIFKITLHKEDLPDNLGQHMMDPIWLDTMQNLFANVNKTEEALWLAQQCSESMHAQEDRCAVRARFGRELPFKNEDACTLEQQQQQRDQEVLRVEEFYFAIKNVQGFLRQSYTIESATLSGSKSKVYWQNATFCVRCCGPFYSHAKLADHTKFCLARSGPVRESMPGDLKVPQLHETFKRHCAKERAEIVIYADFESLLTSPEVACQICQSSPENARGRCKCHASVDSGIPASTKVLNVHTPMAFGYVAVDSCGKLVREHLELFQDDASCHMNGKKRFIQHFLDLEPFFQALISKDETPRPVKADLDRFFATKACVICEQPFDFGQDYYGAMYYRGLRDRGLLGQRIVAKQRPEDGGEQIVHHHHHIKKEWIGPAHFVCNVEIGKHKKVQIFLHNFSGYDSSLLLDALDDPRIKFMSAIAGNTNRLKSLTFNIFRISDSLNHLPASLSTLVDNLKQSCHTFPILQQSSLINDEGSKEVNPEKLHVAQQKSYYPYEAATSIAWLKSQTQLPPPSAFSSVLTASMGLNETEYAFAQKVFRLFECANMYDYCAIYLWLDCLLLAEVFEVYMEKMHELFGLYPNYYLSMPAYTFDAFLYSEKVRLPFIQDRTMYRAFEDSVRGGLCFVNKRLAVADEPGDEGLHWSTLLVDANSLYSIGMVQKLPFSNFEWLTVEAIQMFDTTGQSWDLEGEYGYLLNVDLAYPAHLHRAHNDFPLAPTQMVVPYDMLSRQTKQLMVKLGRTRSSIANRKLRISLKIVCKPSLLEKHMAAKTYMLTRPITENIAMVFHRQDHIVLNKFPHIGATILDLAKAFMYKAHYEWFMPALGPSASLCFGDTDSLAYHYISQGGNEDILSALKPHFDFSNLPQNHHLYSIEHENAIFKFKDESGTKVRLSSVVALAPKVYSIKYVPAGQALASRQQPFEDHKCKGVSKVYVKKELSHDHYLQALLQEKQIYASFAQIRRSGLTKLETVETRKSALTSLCVKRHYFDCAIHSAAFGSVLIDQLDGECFQCREEKKFELWQRSLQQAKKRKFTQDSDGGVSSSAKRTRLA